MGGGWGGCGMYGGSGEAHTGFWWGKLRQRDHLEDMCRWQDNTKMIFKKQNGWRGMDWIDLTLVQRQVVGFCEHDNKPGSS